jgi:phage antirepressor YoqD-like protein
MTGLRPRPNIHNFIHNQDSPEATTRGFFVSGSGPVGIGNWSWTQSPSDPQECTLHEMELFDDKPPALSGRTVFIDFDGGQVAVVLVDGEPMPILRPASDTLGLKWSGQHEKIQNDPAVCVREIRTQLPGDRQARVVLTTDLDGFSLWLAKINANKVSPEARDLVITWQRKAARAIRERFFGKLGESAADVVPALPQDYESALVHLLAQVRENKALATRNAELEPKADYVDTYVKADKDATILRVVANQLQVSEQWLREYLINRNVIYRRVVGTRWSHSKGRMVTEYEYQPKAKYKPWFHVGDQPEAPRLHNGQMRTTLYVTPVGKVAIARLIQRQSA